MEWTLLTIVGAIILLAIGVKFLSGIMRAIVILALTVFIIALALSYFTGEDYIGYGPTAQLVKDTTDDTKRTINHKVNDTVNLVVELPQRASSPTTAE